MKKTLLTLCSTAMLLSACSTVTKSPVDQAFQSQLKLGQVDVSFPADRKVPAVYDKAVRSLVDGEIVNTSDTVALMTYIDSNGGAGDEDEALGERYLEYRIEEELKLNLENALVGPREVDLDVDIEKIVTPNAATMILVGEVKGINYDLKVKDADTGTVLLEYTEPSKPFVERSSGALGGALGLALRSGKDTNLQDLEQMIEAVVIEIKQILTGTEVNKTVVKKIRVNEEN